MRRTFWLLALVAMATPVAAQPSPKPLPRTPWGDPDLQGIWDFRSAIPLERPEALGDAALFSADQAEVFEDRRADRLDAILEPWADFGRTLGDDRRTSLITDPPSGRIPPLTPEARQSTDRHLAARQRPVRLGMVLTDSLAHGPEDLGLSERCIIGLNMGPPMLPSAFNNNVQVFQTPGYVVLLHEMINDARIVPLDGRPHLPGTIRQWMGNPRGSWDGDTLVVESRNFTDKTGSFRELGSGETLHLIERFTRLDEATLLYEFTIDDQTTFTRPFTGAIPMKSIEGPLFEYACHEGNARTMELILGGARAQEQAAAAPRP